MPFQKSPSEGGSGCQGWVEGALFASPVQAVPICKGQIRFVKDLGYEGKGREEKKEQVSM